LADISSLEEPVQAKFPEFHGNFVKDDVMVSAIGLSPAETGCFSSWEVVLLQGGRKMAFIGREDLALKKEKAAICGLLAALPSEHPRERDPDPILWAPRRIIYPMETAELMHRIRIGQSSLIPDDLADVCGSISYLISAWERNVEFKMSSYEKIRSFRYCFEGRQDRLDVITILRQIMKVCRELRILEDRLAQMPRGSTGA
jgi:hypothetical protein